MTQTLQHAYTHIDADRDDYGSCDLSSAHAPYLPGETFDDYVSRMLDEVERHCAESPVRYTLDEVFAECRKGNRV